jgi:hypothetical protein
LVRHLRSAEPAQQTTTREGRAGGQDQGEDEDQEHSLADQRVYCTCVMALMHLLRMRRGANATAAHA